MTDAPVDIVTWVPWIIVAVLLLLLAPAAFLLWRLSRRKTESPPAEEAVDDGAESRWTTVYIRGEVRRALKTLAQMSDNGGNPYSVPWVVAAGAAGADTRTLLHAVDPDAGNNEGIIPSSGSVHFCRHGAVFHAGDTLLDNTAGLRLWRRLIRLMSACRPHRPVDGLVLTLPASMLTGPDAMPFDRLADRGARFCEMIASVQRLTGLRVPVTVVISGCDRLQGFSALVSTLPDESLAAPLGWSMPYSLETAYQPHWADEAVESIATGLSGTAIQVMMTAPTIGDPDGLLVLPSQVRRLAPRLKPLLAAMFQPSAYHEAFLFRGLYLCGAMPGEQDRWAFVQDLFNGKVFREYQLVRPVQGVLTARTKRLRIAQMVLAGCLALEVVGLTRLAIATPQKADSLRLLMATIQSDLGGRIQAEGRLNPDMAQEAAIRLLQELARLDVVTLTTPLAPYSYLANPDTMLEQAISAGYGNIVVDEIRQRLTRRLTEILDAPEVAGHGDGDVMGQMDSMISALTDFDRVYGLYQSLPTLRSAKALAAVVRYTLGIELPPGFEENAHLYQQAMGITPVPPIDQATGMTGRALRAQFTAAFRARFDEVRLRRRFDQIAKFMSGDEPRDPDEAMDRLTGLQEQLRIVAEDLDSRDYGWINGEGNDIGPRFDAMLTRLDGITLVDDDDVAAIRQIGENQIVEARRQLFQKLTAERNGQLQLEGGKAVLAQTFQTLRANLDALMARPFMSEAIPSQPALRSGERPLMWDSRRIKQAEALLENYQAFIASDVMKFPASVAFAVEMAAFDQAGQRVETALSAAAQPAERVIAGPYHMETELRGLLSVGQSLGSIAEQLRLAKMDALSVRLGNTVQTQGERLLGAVDGMTAGMGLIAPPPKFEWWDGSMPLAARTFRASSLPELSIQMESDREGLSKLVHDYAVPLLQVMSALPGDRKQRDLVTKWQSLGRSLARYEQKDRDSSLRRLEQFILVEMDQIDPAHCSSLGNGPPTPGGDVFAVHLDELKDNLAKRCEDLGGNRVRDQYARIQGLFNETLAGRFPFARDPTPATPRADPLAVRRFFWTLDQNPLPARAVIEAAAGRAAGAFIADLAASGKALAPMLVDPTLDQPLIYEVEAEFRTNAPRDVGGNQIIEWGLECSGDQWLSSREPKRTLTWSSGQPIRLFVRFARNAPSVPAPDPLGRYRVDGTMATWEAADPWALLSLLSETVPDSDHFLDLPDRRPQALMLTLDLQRNPDAAPGGVWTSTARVYLRLGLTAVIRKSGKPDEKIPLVVPTFPYAAPVVESASSSPSSSRVR